MLVPGKNFCTNSFTVLGSSLGEIMISSDKQYVNEEKINKTVSNNFFHIYLHIIFVLYYYIIFYIK